MLKEFLVANRVQGIQPLLGINAAGLVNKTLLHHHLHTAVDAFVEFFPVAVQSYLQDSERTRLFLVLAERSICLAGHDAYFKGVNHALGVLLVDDGIIFRVETLQFFTQFLQSLFIITPLHHTTRGIIHSRYIVDSVA